MASADVPARGRWGKHYPPLLAVAVVLLIVLAVLPSGLNLPQSNPSETLEYAPVPPDDSSDVPPQVGNFSSLGLAGSSSLSGDVQVPPPPGGPPVGDLGGLPVDQAGAARSPSTKRCVGRPPRQTEDPLSPPCVAHFEGDNFGSTYQGVTREEVRVLAYVEGGYTRPTSRGTESSPTNVCFDLAQPPKDNDDVYVRFFRAFQRHFNERYQTYGRFVRFFVCFSNGSATGPEDRRGAAVEHFETIKPFAILNYMFANPEPYTDYMTRRGVMSFTAAVFVPAEIFRQRPKLVWGYLASLEQSAEVYANYVCQKVVPHRVSFSGNPGDMGQPRKLGLLRTDNPGYQHVQTFARLVKEKVTACGGNFVSEATYPSAYAVGSFYSARPNYAQENIARFQQDGVTTILWAGAWEEKHTAAAAASGYRPEWVAAGDQEIEGYDTGQFQEQSVWRHAWVVSDVTRIGAFEEELCYQALQDAEPGFPREDAAFACPVSNPYESLRQLFTGIQVAGPRLGPTTIDKGFRAIPAVRSTDPRVPACYYEPGDFTCVKDAISMWWDPAGRTRNNRSGCWRMPEGAHRYRADEWPREDVPARRRDDDVCNGFAASVFGS